MRDKDVSKILLWKKPAIEVLGINRLNNINKIKHYIGYEISGYLHLGALVGVYKIVDIQKIGQTEVFLADWHTWINNKLGGDINLIRKVAKGYFTHAFKKLIEVSGGDPSKTDFVLATEVYNNDYWAEVIKIGKNTTLSRVLRSITIMGRSAGESIPSAWLIYPLMQAADIIFQKINVAHAGIDQRKAHVIAIEYADKINYPLIAVHHQLITNLKLPYEVFKKLKEGGSKREAKEELSELKMSKSIPGSAILIHDSPEKIKEAIMNAFCPQGELEFNPIWEIVEYLIFRDQENYGVIEILKENGFDLNINNYEEYENLKNQNKINWEDLYKKLDKIDNELVKISYKEVEFEIVNKKTGERKVYRNLWELREDWINKKIHPLDLKEAVSEWLIKTLYSVYEYFSEGGGRKYKEELDSAQITR